MPTSNSSPTAPWYVDVPDVADQRGRLRSAVLVETPRGRQFVAFDGYLPPAERLARAVDVIVDLYFDEIWYRRPDEIRCHTQALTNALRDRALDTSVRTDSLSRKFVAAAEAFAEHVHDTAWDR